MSNPLISIIIPTHNRPELLPRAVESALAQTLDDFEVIVVDDASTELVQLPEHPRLRLIRLDQSHGGAGARNVGTKAAQGRWITYLDDDDRLLPHMAAVSLDALSRTQLPTPVGVISGIEVVDAEDKVISKRLPPPLRPKGAHFSLEKLEPGKSYNTKQTLVVERDVILKIGSWDEAFRSRVHSELFFRLNPACSILGLPTITYQMYAHQENRVSRNPTLRQESFNRLIRKHESLFKAHPKMFADFILENARKYYEMGQPGVAVSHILWAIQIHPRYTFRKVTGEFQEKLKQR
ncbi:glycosyltransferase family 2 protein [Gloeocapsopsis dulcis]|uniref:Glycosyl transferase family 2 n=1 Tax=Gloeocapsopsis dulcis AAB1 = 1H9 TaxID=1433147 RepID=A0A6N8FSP2_9CHRO|nr:glycosyltransferase family 2 protein [Gloeocapsopsis dulcis]MUL35207.1 glycosyl transferase family 2 [Gloeocapsopsis dulcis AAB1 = 1H9]WNN89093.1 glycosyltransferase family 2 protein [Gloeocapsopsis dulcis]